MAQKNNKNKKTAKSKAQQAKDLGKLAVVAATAGAATHKIVKKVGGKSKKNKKLAATLAILAVIVIGAVGALNYYDIPPFTFDLGFKYYYMSEDSFTQSDGNLQVRFLDVGQGDCILIQLPDGKNMLIDGGKNNEETESTILKTLENLKINTIDIGILTHTDADHCGSMDGVIASNVSFKKIYMPLVQSSATDKVKQWYEADTAMPTAPADFVIQTVDSGVYKSFVTAVENEKCEVEFNYQDKKIIGEGYEFTFYNPTYQEYKKVSTAAQKNNVSPVMILKFNDKKIMFTGDIDAAESNFIEKAAKGNKIDFNVDVLKVAHHGGKQSTSENFLAIAQPEYSVIQVGENSYNHPTSEVVKRLQRVESKIFTTLDKGDIILTLKGSKMGFSFKKTNSSFGSASEYDGEDIARKMNRFVPIFRADALLGGRAVA